jgi:Bax protein
LKIKGLLHRLQSPQHPWHWTTGLVGSAVLVAVTSLLPSTLPQPPKKIDLISVKASAASELKATFAKHDFSWPPPSQIPPLAPAALPQDLASLPTKQRKSLFLRLVLPLALAENRHIRRQRLFLQRYFAGELTDKSAPARAQSLADDYDIDGDLDDQAVQTRLLRRVDELPPVLVLAQAAIESGWGTSRFAQQGNNLFGRWTYDESQGMIPERRHPDKTHAVKVYPNLRASVRDYLETVNTNDAYKSLRELRAKMRRLSGHLDPLRLSDELTSYSERGEAYVEDVKLIINSNHLARYLDGVELASS